MNIDTVKVIQEQDEEPTRRLQVQEQDFRYHNKTSGTRTRLQVQEQDFRYDAYTRFMLDTGRCTREHLRLVPVLESWHSARNPEALMAHPLSLQEVQDARPVTPNISLVLCTTKLKL